MIRFSGTYLSIITWLVLILILSAALVIPVQASHKSDTAASRGVLDLTEWDFHSGGTIALQGEWEFYWNTLAAPEDFRSSPLPNLKFASVPHVWGTGSHTESAPNREGFGTYRLILKLGKEEEGKLKSLYIRSVASAYRLWVNGELIEENGTVGRSRAEMKPKNYAKTVSFSALEGDNEMVLQVSNFVQRKGGLWTSVKIGSQAAISRERDHNVASQLFIASALITMGAYHFGLFLLRKQDRLSLLSGGFCLLLSLRTLLLGDTLLIRFFPWIDWQWAVKFEYLCPYLGVPVFCMFFQLLYPKEVQRRVLQLIYGISGIFSAIVLLLPARVFTYTMQPFQGFLLAVIGYLFYVLVVAAKRRRVGAKISIGASLVMVVTVVHDILYYNHIIHTFDLTPYGILLFFFVQTLVVALKFSKAYEEVELLSSKLADMNYKLEEKIKDRTAALEVSNSYLVYANEHLNRVENSRRELIANITHEMGTPMTSIQGYMKALLDGVIHPEKKYIQIIYDKIQMAERLVQDLFDLTKLEEGQTTFHLVDVIVDELFDEHFSLFQWEVESQGIRFELDKPECPDELLAIVRIDPIRIRQVMTNLLHNALNYTEEGGLIRISGEYRNDQLIITVSDTGKGIEPDVLPYIFNRFVKGAGPRRNAKDGTGLGLSIAKEIVMHHGGVMTVRSEQNQGSSFQFDLPVEFIPMVVD